MKTEIELIICVSTYCKFLNFNDNDNDNDEHSSNQHYQKLMFSGQAFSLLILTTGSRDSSPMCQVIWFPWYQCTAVCLKKLTRNQKMFRTIGFFLDFFI